MGAYPHGEVFYGYDLGDLTAPAPDARDRWDRVYIGPPWMLDDPGNPDNGMGDYDPADQLAALGGWVDTGTYAAARPVLHDQALTREQREADPAYRAWSDDIAARRAAIASVDQGCDLSAYGGHLGEHPDGARLRVAIRESIVRVSYECAPLRPVMADRAEGSASWSLRLHAYLDQLAIPVPDGGPGWYVTSDYG